MKQNAISPTRQENFPEWYQQVIKSADLAESSPVRGCMVIKPWGYGIWENMQQALDQMFKETGHQNAYFPLLIPLSFLEKEAAHVEGFAKECAVVTHHRLEASSDGKLVPKGELEEPYVIRPTSETIIGHSFAKWIQSYRDLPLKINQWANVMRWEMRTRLFLRTSEFLWQEGHTAHTSAQEAQEETLQMLEVYRKFAKEWMALPVICGTKTPDERFPGADETYTVEAMAQDCKAIQAGTSHFLGQNFSRASGIEYSTQDGSMEYAWTTSWGVSTRLVGSLIMAHSDDDGVRLPPRLAPHHIVILPIYKNDEQRKVVMDFANSLAKDLNSKPYHEGKIRAHIDDRDIRGGEKSWQHIKKGTPIRLEIGPRDVAKNSVFMGRRDKGPKQKEGIDRHMFSDNCVEILDQIQKNLYEDALSFQKKHTVEVDKIEDFEAFFTPPNGDTKKLHGGFVLAHWCEKAIGHPLLDKLKVTPRCIPMDLEKKTGTCLFTGEKTETQVIFAKAY